MKQILLKNSVTSSYAANCLAFDKSSNESVFEIRWAKRKSVDTCYLHDESILEETEKEEEIPDIFMNEADGFGMVKENILYYICGFIVRRISKKIDCLTCCDNLLETFNEHNYAILNENSKLVAIKNRGGLVKSSYFVVKVVKFVEKTLIDLTFNFKSVKMLNSSLTSKIIIFAKNYVYNSNILVNVNCPNDGFLENHKLELVTIICKEYLKIRLHHVAKSKTSDIVSKRRLLTKLVLFNHQ